MNIEAIINEFRADIEQIIHRAWPTILADELHRLGQNGMKNVATKNGTKRTKRTGYKAALETYGTKRAAARALGLAESTYRDRLHQELAI